MLHHGQPSPNLWRVILTQWRKASDILTSTLADFLFGSHPKRERHREGHLNYYTSAYNTQYIASLPSLGKRITLHPWPSSLILPYLCWKGTLNSNQRINQATSHAKFHRGARNLKFDRIQWWHHLVVRDKVEHIRTIYKTFTYTTPNFMKLKTFGFSSLIKVN